MLMLGGHVKTFILLEDQARPTSGLVFMQSVLTLGLGMQRPTRM